MLIYALGLFAIAALFGIYMLLRVVRGVLPPPAAPIIHGLFAATGLLLLLYSTFFSGIPARPSVAIAALLLLVAALGGFLVVSFHLRKQVPPRMLAGLHGLLAVVGFLTLAGGTFGVF
jgi:hypothetical protein